MWPIVRALPFIFLEAGTSFAACPPGNSLGDVVPPTDLQRTFIRKGLGEFGTRGGKHQGTDITVRSSYADKEAYHVSAMAAGTVVYARFNGDPKRPFDLDGGYGNTVIIDHGNNCYSFYAHLASEPFTPIDPSGALMVRPGQKVGQGETIGYFVDQDKGVASTGNAMRTDSGARWQTHVVFIDAPSGWSGGAGIGQPPLGGKFTDATPVLLSLGYKIENGAPGTASPARP